ncbi:DUF7344 domain-containing protein [Salinigranum marinum]|uniref:DUF7344 domain-containing protein n=1 Tax=Salinigranum marinum TaxID=1515595 RepID=UPI002989EB14|nr:hypothetical protein [Salinigranum marinum]
MTTHIDDAFDLLTHRYRRRILRLLAARETPLTLSELVDGLVTDTPGPPRRARDAVALDLYHSHLPKLVAAGWVDCDCGGRILDCRVSLARPPEVDAAVLAAMDELEAICAAVRAGSI